ncbi:MAG TPA: YIP1 family protein [Candidatus Binatia bacterium]|nr:YIP1 family protein [Candidatus Binatia bacterium]
MNEQGNTGGETRGGSEVVDAPSQSAIGTLIGIFISPKKTFESLAARPRILAPVLLLVVFHLVLALVVVQSGLQESDTIAKMEQKGAPPEQIEGIKRVMESPARFLFALGGPIAVGFILLVSSAVLYFMANLMLGARLRFTHYLCIVAYAGIVSIVDNIAQIAIGLSRGTLFVSMGIGAFLGDNLSYPLRVLDVATDPLLLWTFGIQALGVAVMARRKLGFGVAAVALGFVAGALVRGLAR